MQKSFYFWLKNRIRGKCWSKEEARMAFRRDAYALKGRSKIAPHALNQRSPAEGKAKSVWELKKAKKKESVEICEICGTRTNSRKRRRFLPSKPQKSKTFPRNLLQI